MPGPLAAASISPVLARTATTDVGLSWRSTARSAASCAKGSSVVCSGSPGSASIRSSSAFCVTGLGVDEFDRAARLAGELGLVLPLQSAQPDQVGVHRQRTGVRHRFLGRRAHHAEDAARVRRGGRERHGRVLGHHPGHLVEQRRHVVVRRPPYGQRVHELGRRGRLGSLAEVTEVDAEDLAEFGVGDVGIDPARLHPDSYDRTVLGEAAARAVQDRRPLG